MKKDELVWMPYEEVVAQEQWELYCLSQMFPTLKGFLWDTVEKEESMEINLDNSEI